MDTHALPFSFETVEVAFGRLISTHGCIQSKPTAAGNREQPLHASPARFIRIIRRIYPNRPAAFMNRATEGKDLFKYLDIALRPLVWSLFTCWPRTRNAVYSLIGEFNSEHGLHLNS